MDFIRSTMKFDMEIQYSAAVDQPLHSSTVCYILVSQFAVNVYNNPFIGGKSQKSISPCGNESHMMW